MVFAVVVFVIVGLLFWLVKLNLKEKPSDASGAGPEQEFARESQTASDSGAGGGLSTGVKVIGRAQIIDGDSIRIKKTEIRLFGVDAPEIAHPYGQKAKWALVKLCKGQDVTAEIVNVDTHGRTVAKCLLPDGRDLSAEMVKLGLAIDWPKFSGGEYRVFEPPGVRRQLWLADARQNGRMDVWEKFEATQKQRRK